MGKQIPEALGRKKKSQSIELWLFFREEKERSELTGQLAAQHTRQSE
jgi:hypothetical protein